MITLWRRSNLAPKIYVVDPFLLWNHCIFLCCMASFCASLCLFILYLHPSRWVNTPSHVCVLSFLLLGIQWVLLIVQVAVPGTLNHSSFQHPLRILLLYFNRGGSQASTFFLPQTRNLICWKIHQNQKNWRWTFSRKPFARTPINVASLFMDEKINKISCPGSKMLSLSFTFHSWHLRGH